MKQTKLEKLVSFLKTKASTGETVTRSTITRRFRNDPAYVVYFNGLRRNGAVTRANTVNVRKISSALTAFRKENLRRQNEHYARMSASSTSSI